MPNPIDRSWALPQLQQNPALLQRMADMVKGEVGLGRDPTLERIQLETAFNRAQARGIPLEQSLLSVADNPRKGYYASDTYSRPASQGQMDYFQKNVLQPVLGGSNTGQEVLKFVPTGNASGRFAANRAATGMYGNNTWYSGKPGVGEMFVTERPDMKFAQNPTGTQVAQNNDFGHSPEYAAQMKPPPPGFPQLNPLPTAPAGLLQSANPPTPADPFAGAPKPPETAFSDRFAPSSNVATNLPSSAPEGMVPFMAPGSSPNPMTVASLPQVPQQAPNIPNAAPPTMVADATPAMPTMGAMPAPSTPQPEAGNGLLGNGSNPLGMLGGLGGLAGASGGSTDQTKPPQMPVAPPFHPQVNMAPLLALLQQNQQSLPRSVWTPQANNAWSYS